MQLVRNLSDEELTDLVLEDDEQYLRQRLQELPAALRLAAERPETFWQRQQTAIRRRTAAPRASAPLLAARAAAVLLALAAVFLLRSGPAEPPARVATESDQQLLLSVERAVHSDVPQALEPAALLADDIFSGAQSRTAAYDASKGERQ